MMTIIYPKIHCEGCMGGKCTFGFRNELGNFTNCYMTWTLGSITYFS